MPTSSVCWFIALGQVPLEFPWSAHDYSWWNKRVSRYLPR